MILTGAKYEEFFEIIWGKNWKTVGERRLDITRQALHNRCKSKTGLPRRIKRELLAVAEDQLALLGKIVTELNEDLKT